MFFFNVIFLVTLYHIPFHLKIYTFLLLQDYTEFNFEATSAKLPVHKNVWYLFRVLVMIEIYENILNKKFFLHKMLYQPNQYSVEKNLSYLLSLNLT